VIIHLLFENGSRKAFDVRNSHGWVSSIWKAVRMPTHVDLIFLQGAS